ncbi:Arm DNA-binding domain-containing protein [Paraburkholderia aspalathi]|uniref:Arm DNA-binding domain-containing protein n=1 Tax=Paraburkholderia aspalathi TaxID=1324617 RepID=UPI003CB00073
MTKIGSINVVATCAIALQNFAASVTFSVGFFATESSPKTDIRPKMKFDARRAKLLQPQQHIAFDDFPGLRLEATATRRTWTYRYRSPLDGNMRQIKLGDWPAMPLAAVVVQRETKRGIRDTGEDPALARRRARGHVAVLDAKHGLGAYTVR